MKLHPRVTRAGLALVKRFEGYRRHAARATDGGYVVGYRHTQTAREGAEVSEADAEALLWFDLSRTAEGVEAVVLAPTSDGQFEALTAFAFNIGLENFAGSTVVRRLNEGAYLQAAAAIELWRRADFDGEALVVDALVRRRAAEKAHFLGPLESPSPAPTDVIRPRFDDAVVAAALAWGERAERAVIAASDSDESPVASHPASRLGDWAPSAAIAAADAVSARLSRILPDAPTTVRNAPPPVAEAASSPPPLPSPFDPPPPASPPPVRAFAFEPSVARRDERRLFGAPSDASVAQAPDPRPSEPVVTIGAPFVRPSLRPLLENPAVFAGLGAVGLALFVSAVACMFRRPSLLCLLAGLVGVVAMAPAAAFFLFRAMGAPADMKAPQTEAEPQPPPATDEPPQAPRSLD